MNRDRTVLHVDDDPQICRVVAKRLERHGYNVTSINDPAEVLQELVRDQWRVILLDIDLPNIYGLDLLRDIKAFDNGIQVIMLTGMVSLSTVLQSLRLGAEACLFKPLDSVEPLVEVLDDTFRKVDRWWSTLDELSQRGLAHTL